MVHGGDDCDGGYGDDGDEDMRLDHLSDSVSTPQPGDKAMGSELNALQACQRPRQAGPLPHIGRFIDRSIESSRIAPQLPLPLPLPLMVRSGIK